MSIWSKLIGIKKTEDRNNIIGYKTTSVPYSAYNYAIVDVEIGLKDHRIHDIGALKHDDTTFHKTSKEELFIFLNDIDYICGHNIVHHDAKYLFTDKICRWILVDTLYVSPLLFPEHPYHRLVKDDKLMSEQMNNPVNDCKKAKDLLLDEIACWHSLPKEKRILFASLLKDKKEFEGFLNMVSAEYIHKGIPELIKELYAGKICQHADLDMLTNQYPCGLAYALALIDTTDYRSITPGWVLYNYPEVEFIVKLLRHTTCKEGCDYCHTQLDVLHNLKIFFGYERFRTYEGEPLQERAAQAAVKGESLLAIFPTGGGRLGGKQRQNRYEGMPGCTPTAGRCAALRVSGHCTTVICMNLGHCRESPNIRVTPCGRTSESWTGMWSRCASFRCMASTAGRSSKNTASLCWMRSQL